MKNRYTTFVSDKRQKTQCNPVRIWRESSLSTGRPYITHSTQIPTKQNHYLFFDCLYVNLFRVLSQPVSLRPHIHIPETETYGTYSPNFLPTISSVITTSWYVLPLCTANFSPTKLGRIVAARFCVLIGGVFGGGGICRGRGRLLLHFVLVFTP